MTSRIATEAPRFSGGHTRCWRAYKETMACSRCGFMPYMGHPESREIMREHEESCWVD